MNGEVCCILGVCCPPGSSAQIDALAKEMSAEIGAPAEKCLPYAAFMLRHFDLAPAGSLAQLKDAVATLARKRAKD